jgi:signal transduction histidine kinase
MLRRPGPLAFAILGWTALGVLFALPQLRDNAAWMSALQSSIASWWAWGLVSALIAAADRRLPFTDRQIGLRLFTHIPIGIALTVLYSYLAAALNATIGPGSFSQVLSSKLLRQGLQGMMLWSLLVYWLILGGYLAKQYYERYVSAQLRNERLERLSTEARMHALRLQLDPHFLFNALNTISSQVETDPRLARSMIEHLGDLLRLNLESNPLQMVPLEDELAFLEHYLAIQRIRFGDRLRLEKRIDDRVRHALLPSMTIQPLVENAIRHGISSRASGGLVRVLAGCDANNLTIQIEDDGVGLPEDWDRYPREGHGLSITRQRLAGFYPEASSHFSLRARDGGGVLAELRIPLAFESIPSLSVPSPS